MGHGRHSKNADLKIPQLRTPIKIAAVCIGISVLLIIAVILFGDKINIGKKAAKTVDENVSSKPALSETVSKPEQEQKAEAPVEEEKPQIETVTMYTTIDLNVRSAPDTKDEKNVLGEIKKGGEVSVIEKGPENWYKVLYNGKEGYCYAKYIAAEKPAENPVQPTAANTAPYYIKVNRAQNIVTVYKADENGEYTVPFKSMTCSVGTDGKTPTGTWKTSDKFRWGSLKGRVYGQYSTRIYGPYLFHSVPYFSQNCGDLEYEEYNKLGQPASAGCVRLCVADAKWIYDNCPAGTTVTIYDSADPEPLPAPAPIRIDVNDSRRGWDPTDPDPNNPWKKAEN